MTLLSRWKKTARLPVELRDDPEEFHVRMAEKYSHGLTEIGLFRRSGGALADVLRGEADPLTSTVQQWRTYRC